MVGKMDYIQQMTAARKRLTLKIQKYQNALDQLPEGSLRASKNGSSYKYYQVIGKERRYLPQSEKQLIGSLAKKRFLSAEILDAEKEIKAIDLFLRNHQTDSVTDMLLARENGIAEAPAVAPWRAPCPLCSRPAGRWLGNGVGAHPRPAKLRPALAPGQQSARGCEAARERNVITGISIKKKKKNGIARDTVPFYL